MVIGNGFDLHHGLRSSYADFREWLKYVHPMLYREFHLIYGKIVSKGEWWKDFEMNLGVLDFVRFYKRCHKEIPQSVWIEARKYEPFRSGFPISISWHPAGNRLRSLYFMLDVVMKEWIKDISSMISVSRCIEMPPKSSSLFLTFNYTNLLEYLYKIPDNKILHIHGSVDNGDEIIFGHNQDPMLLEFQYEDIGQWKPSDEDIQEIEIEFSKKQKRPDEYIHRYSVFFQSLSQVQNVYIYGLSFSEVDMAYIQRIHNSAPQANWC